MCWKNLQKRLKEFYNCKCKCISSMMKGKKCDCKCWKKLFCYEYNKNSVLNHKEKSIDEWLLKNIIGKTSSATTSKNPKKLMETFEKCDAFVLSSLLAKYSRYNDSVYAQLAKAEL